MPNRNRQRGDYFERQTRTALDAAGWLAIRSAGSLGVADIVALKAGHTPMLVSCKLNGALPRAQRQLLREKATAAGAVPVLAWRLRRGWVALEIVTITGRHHHHPELLHVPPRNAREKAETDGLLPAGEQMALPFG